MNRRRLPFRSFAARLLPSVLALTFCFAVVQAPAQDEPKQLTPKERLEVFQDVWESVRDAYVDEKMRGLDWKAVREKYRPEVEKIQTDGELWPVLNRMVGELNDAHTQVLSPRTVARRKARESVAFDVELALVEGRIVVESVLPDSEAAKAGVTPGMTVRFVNNRPIADLWKELKEDISLSSSSRATSSRLVRWLYRPGPDGTLKLTIEQSETTNVIVAVGHRVVSSEVEATGRMLPSGIAYVSLSGFGGQRSKAQASEVFRKALDPYRKAPGLILDLRDNHGGLLQEALTIAGYFLGGNVPVGIYFRRGTGTLTLNSAGLGKAFNGRVVVLTNEGTASAAELFASFLQENGKTTVIGTQTCGCVLGFSRYRKLKGGAELTISESAFFNTRGKLLEGTGVVPNKVVPLTIADLKSGRDAALVEAERILLAPPAK